MTRPCRHDAPEPGCSTCTLYGTDPHFRALWGGGPLAPKLAVAAAKAPGPARSLPCVYLGDVTDRLNCHCPGKWLRKCALHGKVSINGNCKTCGEYDAA